ncbi:SWIM zinc finger domain-containing protein [Sporosarcina siberiensis]|uniref:SWIM zinc finger domain-containing protein n=1 Tax=Sporosarcina siberiensis TaxID=1365606 RepID=A0ABW4SC43_9BACL
MNIHSFENEVSKKIVDRGLDYYENGNILVKEFQGNNTYSFLVSGTTNYRVNVRIDDNGSILYSICGCPYDMGNVCKHEVAVYYDLREISVVKNENKPERQSDLKEALSHLTKEKLIEVLMDLSSKDLVLKNHLLDHYCKEDPSFVIDTCKNLIDETIEEYAGEDKYISSRDVPFFVDEIEDVLDIVKDQKEHLLALFLAGMLLEKSMGVFRYSDDADGELANLIDRTLESIKEIAVKVVALNEQEKFMSKIFALSDSPVFEGWEDYRNELLAICQEFSSNEILRLRLTRKMESLLL